MRTEKRVALEQRTLDEAVVPMDRFWSAVQRLIARRGMSERDATRGLIEKLCRRYKVWNLRGEHHNMRFRDLGHEGGWRCVWRVNPRGWD